MTNKSIIRTIEDFLESYNGIIQTTVFLSGCVIGTLFKLFGIQTIEQITIELLLLLIFQIYLLHIKDSISQRKQNDMSAQLSVVTGNAINFSDINMHKFLKKAKKNVYISGIALDRYIEKYIIDIQNLLKNGRTIDLIISAPSVISESAIMYYGCRRDSIKSCEIICEVLNKQLVTINTILNDKVLKENLEKKNLNIRFHNTVMTTSFIAHDLDSKDRYFHRQIQLTSYQYKMKSITQSPSFVVNTRFNFDHYNTYKEIMKEIWSDSEPVVNIEALLKIKSEIEKKILSCRNSVGSM